MLAKLSTMITLFLASLLGRLQLHAADSTGPMLVLLAAGCLLALLEPRRAWRWAAVLGCSVPLAQGIASITGAALPSGIAQIDWPFLALVPAFLGAAIGAGFRRAATHER